MIRAVVLVDENQALHGAKSLYREAQHIPGVVEAYPALGRHDGIVFIQVGSMRDLRGAIHHVEGLSGVRAIETLIEDED